MNKRGRAKKALREFPKSPKISKLLGPSFIILALGLGSGEVILWPFLVSKWGLGIAWGAFLGITFQYFINMEIERYSLVKGESVFFGLNKMSPWISYWLIFSTFIGFGIPGILAASAKVFANIINVSDFRFVAVPFLISIGLILSLSQKVYDRMEKITKFLILILVPLIFIFAILLSSPNDWAELGKGLVGQGIGYNFLPVGIALATFLAAFAYSGAGGNLSLTQSVYIKEKGYGMGKYSEKISGLFRSKKDEKVRLKGYDFPLTKKNLKRFKTWWRRISIEHLIVFWFIGLVAMLLLMVLSFSTTYGMDLGEDIGFVIGEAMVIGETLFPLAGLIFMIAVSVMLFQTQLGVVDSSTRIMSENFALKKLKNSEKINLSKIYFYFLWGLIGFGIIWFLLGFQPLTLIVLGAVINAVAMFAHIGFVNYMNWKVLPKQLQASVFRKGIIVFIFLFFGVFSGITILSQFGIFF